MVPDLVPCCHSQASPAQGRGKLEELFSRSRDCYGNGSDVNSALPKRPENLFKGHSFEHVRPLQFLRDEVPKIDVAFQPARVFTFNYIERCGGKTNNQGLARIRLLGLDILCYDPTGLQGRPKQNQSADPSHVNLALRLEGVLALKTV